MLTIVRGLAVGFSIRSLINLSVSEKAVRRRCEDLARMYNVRMKIEFEWDKRKASQNYKKHGVAFDEAKTAFFDESALVYHDPDHSEDEERFLLLGNSFKLNTVVVCHCFRESENKIRIISARKADKSEQAEYWESRK